MSAYKQLEAALRRHTPKKWKFTEFEPLQDLPDVTGVTMKIRSVRPLPAAPLSQYQVDWVVTITSGATSRETADPQLFDDLVEFLIDLDQDPDLPWLVWTEAEKVVGEDLERLAYDITVQTHTQKA